MPPLSLGDDQLDRYARHIVLPEIGGSGQLRLLQSHVALVGAGGIGSPAIQYLAAAGVGRLTIIDDDVVSLSNLQRQTLYSTRDVGAHKVAMAANVVARLNRDVQIHPVSASATPMPSTGIMNSGSSRRALMKRAAPLASKVTVIASLWNAATNSRCESDNAGVAGGVSMRNIISYCFYWYFYKLLIQYSTATGSRLRHRYQVATERHGVQSLLSAAMRRSDSGLPLL